MDSSGYDRLLRALVQTPSRRGAVRLLAGSTLGGLLTRGAVPTVARKRKKKVTLCHEGQMITVSKKQKKAHLGHGDTLGSCPISPPPLPPAPPAPPSPPPPPVCPVDETICPAAFSTACCPAGSPVCCAAGSSTACCPSGEECCPAESGDDACKPEGGVCCTAAQGGGACPPSGSFCCNQAQGLGCCLDETKCCVDDTNCTLPEICNLDTNCCEAPGLLGFAAAAGRSRHGARRG